MAPTRKFVITLREFDLNIQSSVQELKEAYEARYQIRPNLERVLFLSLPNNFVFTEDHPFAEGNIDEDSLIMVASTPLCTVEVGVRTV